MPFELKDVTRDRAALDVFLKSGFLLPPVVVIDGIPVQGFQPDRMEELLWRRERQTGDEPASPK